MIFAKVFYFAAVLGTCLGAGDEIRKYLKVCDRNALEVNDCLVEAVREGIAAMTGGIEELGVPPIDPYLQKEFRVEYKNNQIQVKMTLKNIYVHGLKDAKVHDARLRADDDNFSLEIDLTSPKVWITAEYRGEGQFNSLKLLASGTSNTTMTNLVYTWKLKGVPEKKGEETYVRITDFYMRPDVENLKTHLTNSNPDSKDFTDIGNRFAQENWRLLYRELLPYAQANWNKIGVKVANKIFLKVPYNQLFPVTSS